jgi:cysteine desulfurase
MSRFVLDCAVSRPVDAEIAQWLGMAASRGWASPSGGYHEAKISNALLQEASRAISDATAMASTVFLPDTSSAITYAVSDVALRGDFEVIVTSAADPIVTQQASAAAAGHLGLAHEVLAVDEHGRVSDLPQRAVLVTSAVNHEIGCIQRALSEWAQTTRSAIVLEATSAFGWVDLPGADRLILDPRAWGCPAGTIAVASSAASRQPAFDNVPAAVVAGLACQRWSAQAEGARRLARAQVERIASRVTAETADVDIHGGASVDAPHILSLSVLYVDAEALQTRLDALGYAVGSGSACASRSGQPSHVLAAIGALTSGNVRLGLPPGLTDEAVDGFVDAFATVVAHVRHEMGTSGL